MSAGGCDACGPAAASGSSCGSSCGSAAAGGASRSGVHGDIGDGGPKVALESEASTCWLDCMIVSDTAMVSAMLTRSATPG
jgi:hypothetical protein